MSPVRWDPYTGEPWALIPECDAKDVGTACEAAWRAFDKGPWPAMSQTARGKLLRRIGGLIEKHAEHLAQIEVRDNGKLMSEMHAQTKYLPEWFYYYGGLADKIHGAVVPSDRPDHFTYTRDWTVRALQRAIDINGRYGELIKKLNMPTSYVILDRVIWGISAMLGRLGLRSGKEQREQLRWDCIC